VDTGLQGAVASNIIEIDLVSPASGQPIQVEGLSQNINFFIPSRAECTTGDVCGFWSDTYWSSAGCSVAEISDAGITCSCSHLTEFAAIQQGNVVCSMPIQAGYATVVGIYGVGSVIAAAAMVVLYSRKSDNLNTKLQVFSIVGLVFVCRLVAALYFANVPGTSQGLADFLTAVPFLAYFIVSTFLFERVRQAESATALPPSKMSGLFKIYGAFYALGLVALIVAAGFSGDTQSLIAMATTRVLALASILASLLFGAHGILSRPVNTKADVSVFRTYLLSSVLGLINSLVWVALTTTATAVAVFVAFDFAWAAAIGYLHRDAPAPKETPAVPTRAELGAAAV
jgi:hypothetical protein